MIHLGVSKVSRTISGLWQKGVQAVRNLGNHEANGKLGDFTTTPRMVLISIMAIGIGIVEEPLVPSSHNFFISLVQNARHYWLQEQQEVCQRRLQHLSLLCCLR